MAFLSRTLLALAAVAAWSAHAASPSYSPLERQCWNSTGKERWVPNMRDTRAVYFTTLHDGMLIPSPFRLHFGLRGMGIAPAGTDAPNTGHHHLLIDKPLPIDIAEPIPFSDNYKHFGKGFTETVIDLPPGKHRLRLLFADFKHRPYYVYSPEIGIEIVGSRKDVKPPAINQARFAETCRLWLDYELSQPSPYGDGVPYVINLRSGESVTSPFLLQLGAQNAGIAPASTTGATGHFVVDIVTKDGRVMRRTALLNGENENLMDLPPGEWILRPAVVPHDKNNPRAGEDITVHVIGRTPGL